MRLLKAAEGRGVLPDLPLDVTLEDGVLAEEIYDHIKQINIR